MFRINPAAPFPPRLSDLECLEAGDAYAPASGVVPYEVAAPLFSEGSTKRRFLSLPAERPMTPSSEGPWHAEDGTVVLKTFGFPIMVGGPPVPVEVRVMVRAEGARRFATYRWDEDLGDGVLSGDRGEWVEARAASPAGELETLSWWIPGELGCRSCHGLNAPALLGLTTRQPPFDIDAGHVVADQVVALAAAGWISAPESDSPGSAMPTADRLDAPIEDRARAWLHGNCAHCHAPHAYAPADFRFDLRADTPLAEAGLCDVRPLTAGAPRDARLIVPGDPSRSYLLQRSLAPDAERMPPDGGVRVDTDGVALLRAWIEALPACTPQP